MKDFLASFGYIYNYAERSKTVVTVRRQNLEIGMFLTPPTFTKLQNIMEDMESRHKRDLGELKELKKDNKSLELKVRFLQNNDQD